MNRIPGKTLVFLVLLSLLAVDGMAAECRNRISILGSRTAIPLGKVIAEAAEFQEEMKKPKVRDAYKEILKNQRLKAHFDRRVCWVHNLAFLTWTFDLESDGRVRRSVIPAYCLNLSELPKLPHLTNAEFGTISVGGTHA